MVAIMSKLKSYCWCWFSMLALLLSGTTLRAITVPPVVQSLQAMSFSNGWDVVADPGSPGYLPAPLPAFLVAFSPA